MEEHDGNSGGQNARRNNHVSKRAPKVHRHTLKKRQKTGKNPVTITEKKHSGKLSADSGKLYSELFNSMTEGFALHEIICNKKGKPRDYRFLEINPAFEELTGLKRKNVIGKKISEILPDNDPQWVEIYGKVALSGEPVQFDSHSTPLNKDYEVFAYSPAPRQFAVLFTDITERKKRENELHQLNRTLRAITNSSQAMLRWQEDEQAYLDEVCRIIVEDCGHKMVWIGYAKDDKAKSVRPAAYSGFEQGYLETLKLTWADTERGRGPTGTAIRTGKMSMCRNMLTDPKFKPWRKEAINRGYASSIVLPLKNVYKTFGALTIYSKDPDPFSEGEVKLLSDLANDLAYGITIIRLRASEKTAQRRAQESSEELAAANEELLTSNEELRTAHEQVAEQNAVLEAIAKIFRQAMICKTEEELGRTCLTSAEELTQSKFGFIGEINTEGRLDDIAISDPGWAACKAAIPKGHTGYRIVPGGFQIHGIYGRVISEGKGFFTNDPASHPDSIGTPKGHPKLEAFLGVPLFRDGKIVGMLAVGNRDGGFSQKDLDALEGISGAIVQAFMRFRAEEALRKSEQQNRFLADIITSASQAVGVGYPDGRLGMVNKAFEELTGYTAEELRSIDWAKTLTPAKWQKIERQKLDELHRTGIAVRYEKEYIRKNGTIVPIELLVQLVKDAKGKPQYYCSFITDIAERKLAEEALRQSEHRYHRFVEDDLTGDFIADADGRILYCNPAFARIFGFAGRNEAIGSRLDELRPEQGSWENFINLLCRHKTLTDYECDLRRRDGTMIHVIENIIADFGEHGELVQFKGYVFDITERAQAEEALRESEQRLKRAQEIAHLGSWELDVVNNRLTWSDEVYRIFGLAPQEFGATYESFLERIHPDDRAAVDEAYSSSLRKNLNTYEIEHRVIRKDTGEIGIVHEKCEHFRDAAGKIVRSVGMVHDITERKRAESNQVLMTEILRTLNRGSGDLHTLISEVLRIIKESTGFDAVGLRLRNGNDYPYYEQNGFSNEFVLKENSLCAKGEDGSIIRDKAGRVILECTCGLVLSGQTDPSVPCFTRNGSFWTNASSELLALEPETDLRTNPRNRCIHAGFQSVGLFAVRSGEETIGLLQLNGIREGFFTSDSIRFFESLADNIGLALKRKQAEDALRESELRERRRAEELERLGDELEHKNEELESIIRIASHDLRSPLMNIKGFAGELAKDVAKVEETLREVKLSEQVSEKVERVFTKYVPEAVGFIQVSADSINQMIKSLMAVAKAGTVPINIQTLDMNALLAKIAANVQFKLKESGSALEIETLPSCRGDHSQLTQVFTNLIENALKYRDPARPLRIQVYASVDADKVTYCVEDNGKGIAEDHFEKVFDLFTRLDPEAAKGEGIGLTIAKRMVERQGGKIWVSSEVGKASKFYVMMPG